MLDVDDLVPEGNDCGCVSNLGIVGDVRHGERDGNLGFDSSPYQMKVGNYPLMDTCHHDLSRAFGETKLQVPQTGVGRITAGLPTGAALLLGLSPKDQHKMSEVDFDLPLTQDQHGYPQNKQPPTAVFILPT